MMFLYFFCFLLWASFHESIFAFSNTPSIVSLASRDLKNSFYDIDIKTKSKLDKILKLFREEKIDTNSFHGVNGYGYGDIGRDQLDNIIARLMGAEAALVRLQFFSGTHAIATALFASLRPGQDILSVSGKPYDTLEEVLGLRDNNIGSRRGSLLDWGIGYNEVDLKITNSGTAFEAQFDLNAIKDMLDKNQKIKLIHIQRSCGYQWRPSIHVKEMKKLSTFLKDNFIDKGRDLILFCDNCYGELVEDIEPTAVGIDLVAGSLIKNLGGTLAPAGGYIAGRKDLVDSARVELSAPGVEGGATFNQYRSLFQGLFLAPTFIGESLKGSELISQVFGKYLDYECNPRPGSDRTDIIQAVKLGNRQKLISFCESVQKHSPIGSYIKPCPGISCGYGNEVIFADGTFVEGSTLELSADGPLREPFVAFSQGCSHWTHWDLILENLLKLNCFKK